jgi:hypothetical protein
MPPRAARVLLASLAGLGLLTGCGGDKAARALFNQVRTDCASLVGSTVDEATAKFRIPPFVSGSCRTDRVPLGATDVCGGSPGAAYTVPVCLLAYEYCAANTSLCDVGGCAYDCELRVAADTPGQVVGSSVICATTFISGQPFGLLSGQICQ